MSLVSKGIMKDILKFAIGVLILGAIQEIVILFFLRGVAQLTPMLLGTIYGCVYVILSFIHMGYCVEKCVDKDENQAKLYMQTRYTLRMLVLIGVLIAAVYIPFVNVYTAAIPLLFTRIVVMLMSIQNRKKGGESR